MAALFTSILSLPSRIAFVACQMDRAPEPHAVQVISSALAPVLLVSASAILASGISQKHAALADRIRSLSAERRLPSSEPSRRESIEAQLVLFNRRVRLVSLAHRALYLGIGCQLLVILAIALGIGLPTAWSFASLPPFLAGILLLLAAIALELVELQLADRTIALELEDRSHGRKGPF